MTDATLLAARKPARDSIFGVCAALASDFGFDPLWLRLAIGAALMWNMEVALGTYAVLGAIVLVSRLAAPDARRSDATLPEPTSTEGDVETTFPRAA